MSYPLRVPVLLLFGVGLLLLVVSAAGIFAGLALADRIHALLPPITADAAAIGGAAMALGVASLLAGLLHLGMAVVLGRGGGESREGTLVAGIALCAVMAVLALGWSVTALVSAASGSVPAEAMLPAGIGLLGLTGLYAWAVVTLARLRRHRKGAD